MPKFKSVKEAHAYITEQLTKKVDETLADEVFDAVRDAQIVTIRDEVYSKYEPNTYGRRNESGGLADPNNIQMEKQPQNGVLSVVNVTKPNISRGSYGGNKRNFARVVRNASRKSLPELIEYGHGDPYRYDFVTDGTYMQPRPFTETTITMLRISREHIKALRKGLRKRKVNVVK